MFLDVSCAHNNNPFEFDLFFNHRPETYLLFAHDFYGARTQPQVVSFHSSASYCNYLIN